VAGFHHVELWVADFEAIEPAWAWLLESLEFTKTQSWDDGASWAVSGLPYLTLTKSPRQPPMEHDRRRVGMNHLAFDGGSQANVDSIMAAAPNHGWRQLYNDRYPNAGGINHYAGWLENAEGFKVEIVATEPD